MYDVYVYGMVLLSNNFLLKDTFPTPESYSELASINRLPGGQASTCATILNHFGCSVKIDGNHQGTETFPIIQEFYQGTKVDLSSLTCDPDYKGIEDYTLIDKYSHTCFGTFRQFYNDSIKRWNLPNIADIEQAQVAGIDSSFGECATTVAQLCHEHQIPYVTSDCPYDSILYQYASITILSSDFIHSTYPGKPIVSIMKEYLAKSNHLLIVTFGANDIFFGRNIDDLQRFTPYHVKVVSRLSVGDIFKAGCIYALLHQMKDKEIVSFASATAGIACTRYPALLNPPSLKEVTTLWHTSS